MLEVVLDTNILVAGLRSSQGASHRLLQTMEAGLWRPVVSPALALEYEMVLKRLSREMGFNFRQMDEFIDYVCSRARLVQIHFRCRPVLPDPDDDRILEVAVRARSPIVTFNTKDFRGADRYGIATLYPSELLSIIGANK